MAILGADVLKRFISDRSGNFGMMLAIMTLPLLLAIGLGVDYVRYVSAKQHLQDIADSASLAVAASPEREEAKLRGLATKMIAGNAASNRIENVTVASLDIKDDRVDVGLGGNIPTYFMGLANVHRLDVGASSLAIRAVTGSVEVALVLDNTDSMKANDKIGTLKIAAKDLVGKLFNESNASVRVGLVPYADNINVGVANRNASWLSVPKDYTEIIKAGPCKTITHKNGACLWKKPITTCTGTRDGVPYSQQCGGQCGEYEQIKLPTPKEECPKDTVNNYAWKGCIGSRVSAGQLVLDDQSKTVTYPGFLDLGKNVSCLTEIVPLTNKSTTIQNAVQGMITSNTGYLPNTYIPAGLIWGINMLSDTAPLTEGAAYDPDNKEPRKVIVLMTDGLNSRAVVKTGAKTGTYKNASAKEPLQVNADTESVCAYAKSKKIEIFTVSFMVSDEAAKVMLQNCASGADHYYDATDSVKMLAAFSGIAQSLSQVRLAR